MSDSATAACHCRKCREELRLGLPIDMDVFLAAMKQFEKTHKTRCGKGTTFTGPLPSHATDTPK